MITSLRLRNFRSYSDSSFEFDPSVNIIVGPNASGKTNLLEALLVACVGQSYRSGDSGLVKFKKPWARLDALTPISERSVKLERVGESLKKSFLVDDKPLRRLGLDKTIPVVLFEPGDLLLLDGEPSLRRDFLDNLLEQITPGFDKLRQDYRRTLRQRNTLLKKGRSLAEKQLFAWDVRLSELGGQVAGARQQLITTINKTIASVYSDLSKHKTKLVAEYASPFEPRAYSSQMLSRLGKSLELDLIRGFTAHGPHRDDLVLTLNGAAVSGSASRGETRTLLLALKMIELKLLEDRRGVKPLLLLDDVFSELDGKRRRALTQFLAPYQTFITTTDADIVIEHFADKCHVIPTTS